MEQSTCATRLDQSGNRKGNVIRLYNLQQVRQCKSKAMLWFDLVTADVLDNPNNRY